MNKCKSRTQRSFLPHCWIFQQCWRGISGCRKFKMLNIYKSTFWATRLQQFKLHGRNPGWKYVKRVWVNIKLQCGFFFSCCGIKSFDILKAESWAVGSDWWYTQTTEHERERGIFVCVTCIYVYICAVVHNLLCLFVRALTVYNLSWIWNDSALSWKRKNGTRSRQLWSGSHILS